MRARPSRASPRAPSYSARGLSSRQRSSTAREGIPICGRPSLRASLAAASRQQAASSRYWEHRFRSFARLARPKYKRPRLESINALSIGFTTPSPNGSNCTHLSAWRAHLWGVASTDSEKFRVAVQGTKRGPPNDAAEQRQNRYDSYTLAPRLHRRTGAERGLILQAADSGWMMAQRRYDDRIR